MMKFKRQISNYGIAIAAVLLAALLMWAFDPYARLSNAPFLLFFGAVTISAWYGGRGPGVAATLLSGLSANYLFLNPAFGLSLNFAAGFRMALFIIQGVMISFLVGSLRLAQEQTRRSLQQREQAEADLHQSEAAFRAMFNITSVGKALLDAQTRRFLRVNAAYCHITGYTEAELLNLTVDALNHPEDRDHDHKRYRDFLNQGVNDFQTEKRYVRKDGGIVWVLVTGNIISSHQAGQPLRMVAVIQDITDRKQTEEQLRESRTFLTHITDVAPIILYVYDLHETRNVWSNNNLSLVLGYTRDEIQAMGSNVLSQLLHPEDAKRYATHYERLRCLETEEVAEFEYRMQHRDGSWHWLSSREMAYLRDDNGRVKQIVGAAYDISERKQAEAQREQLLAREKAAREQSETASRIKDEFLAVLSHELRSPLNPILGWSTLLQSGKLDAAKTKQALTTIERNAKLQAELIEDLLDVSRILRGKLSLTVSSINLATVVKAAIAIVHLAAEAKSIQIITRLDPEIGMVSGDSTRLQQVVWNLLSNAIKFTPPGGQVEVVLERSDSSPSRVQFPRAAPEVRPEVYAGQTYAKLTVTDTGKGISPDFLPYIFDYFRQADSATTRKFGGLGLGLAIVYHLVELHGGTIRADSRGDGLGATFTVCLPLMAVQPANHHPPPSSEPSADLRGLHILVVDDETDSREIIGFLLEQAGAEVTTTASAKAALATLEQSKPDLLLSDIGMPDMDGYMLISQVRRLPPEQGGTIPAIALTAYAGELNQQQALAAGFHQHVTKPIEPQELIKAITSLRPLLRG
jgi:PAS domain S-box-containing protein